MGLDSAIEVLLKLDVHTFWYVQPFFLRDGQDFVPRRGLLIFPRDGHEQPTRGELKEFTILVVTCQVAVEQRRLTGLSTSPRVGTRTLFD
jgi:hypothetical protein